jgi:hypothetical protein
MSSPLHLNDDDSDGELGEDLKIRPPMDKSEYPHGNAVKLPGDLEHKNLLENMLHILLERMRVFEWPKQLLARRGFSGH